MSNAELMKTSMVVFPRGYIDILHTRQTCMCVDNQPMFFFPQTIPFPSSPRPGKTPRLRGPRN